ncbi:hypothetical protein BT69DRAFT_1357131, partial [Atractiella rhizophila]
MVFQLLSHNPALIPLFGAVGLGLALGGATAVHYLKNNPDVVVNKRQNPQPWNRVKQSENTKFFSWNPDFWKARAEAVDPRRAFLEEDELATGK